MKFSGFKKGAQNVLNSMQTKTLETQLWAKSKLTKENFEAGKQVLSSTVTGAVDVGKGLVGTAIPSSHIHELQNDVENQGGYYREICGKLNTRFRRRDSLIIGGEVFLLSALPASFPDDIEAAYEAAYPIESSLVSLSEKINELDSNGLVGLISGIKGKLFEIRYIEYLNSGKLPDGYTALLANSATQQGWDIAIHGPDDSVASLIQAKATASTAYVREALERYPSMDVVTSEEVYAQLTMEGISEGLIDSGISNADLTATVVDAISSEHISMSFSPPLLTLAMIAFTSYNQKNLDMFEKAQLFGTRSGKGYMAYLLGSGVAAATNTWWVGLAASVVSRYVSEPGKRKFELYRELKKLKSINQRILDRFKGMACEGV